jgi:phosphate transport system protein
MTISPDDLGEVMIQRHFDEELSDLKTKLLRMAGQVEDQIDQALTALVTRDSALARQVIERDHLVNSLDLEIDEESIRLLALHQPAARDLRLVTTAMKIATELERISDLAENVCERAIELNEEPQLKPYIDIPMMGNMARMMVKQSIDAFVKDDAMLARKVLTDDDFVDNLMEQLFRELLSFMLEDTRTISRAIRLSFIAKYLERMADHATNIAELVVYLVEGKNIRHITPPGSSTNSLAES